MFTVRCNRVSTADAALVQLPLCIAKGIPFIEWKLRYDFIVGRGTYPRKARERRGAIRADRAGRKSASCAARTNYRGCSTCAITSLHSKRDTLYWVSLLLVGRGRFELPKSVTSDLQSDPFGRSGIFPYILLPPRRMNCGAGDWNRTHNLLITNQLLCQLSYTGAVVPRGGIEPPTQGFSVPCSTD